jgi:hypothetical protein
VVSARAALAICACGVIIKIAFFSTMSSTVSLTLYLAMGWFGLLGGLVLCKQRGFCFVRPLLLGGICFSAGAIMDLCYWPTPIPGVVHAHEMFHLAVLGGMAFHLSFIWRIARPAPAPAQPDRARRFHIAVLPHGERGAVLKHILSHRGAAIRRGILSVPSTAKGIERWTSPVFNTASPMPSAARSTKPACSRSRMRSRPSRCVR